MGKRQIGELDPSELVVTILVSDLAAVPMQDLGIPMASGLIPIATLIVLEILLSWLALKSPFLPPGAQRPACHHHPQRQA